MPRYAHPRCAHCAFMMVVAFLLLPASVRADEEKKSSEPSKSDAAAQSPSDQAAADQAEPQVLTMALLPVRGGLPETTSQAGLFGEITTNLRDLITRLDRARNDKNVSAVQLRIRDSSIGRGKLQELRAAIHRTREAGKKVYADVQSPTTSDYLLACACDEIIMPESGTLMITGLHAEFTFYKQLFDRLEIHADILQVGDFKGAGEPYTRDQMSEAFRQQYDAILDDYYAQMVETIAQDRGLKKKQVRKLIDQGLFTAKAAKKAGLIDDIAYQDEWLGSLEKSSGKTWRLSDDYGRRQVDTDFSGMTGFFKMIDLLSGNKPRSRSSKKQKIAVVYALGMITTGKSGTTLLGGEVMGSDTIVKALQTAEEDDSVAAIVLRVDSPGGSALASDLIWRQIQTMDKPVIASMGDVAASGGYYISMGCDQILAEPGTLTGSIGVVGGKVAYGDFLDRFGVTTQVLSRGQNSGIFSGHAGFTDSERTAWQAMMTDIYQQFTRKAADGREMDVEELRQLAGGRVWTGRQAKENGLVDQLGTLQDAIQLAAKQGGLEDEDPELLVLPEATSFFDQLLSGNGVSLEQSSIDLMRSHLARMPQPVALGLQEVEILGRLFSEPCVLVMPYRVIIK